MLAVDTAIFAASLVMLVVSGMVVVRSLSVIASFLKMREYVAGFIVLALTTTLPEMSVGIVSAIEKNTAIALGTLIGSNIANLTLIVGIPILLAKGIKIKSRKVSVDAFYLAAISLLPLALMIIGSSISRIDGAILLTVFVLYMRKILKERREFRKELTNRISKWGIIISVGAFIVSIVAVFASARFLVVSGSALALDLAFPPILLGLILIAVGTSIPELVVGISAALQGHTEIGVGDIIGSCVMNMTFIMGLVAVIHPITSNFLLFITSGVYLIIITFIFATFVRSGNRLDWFEGISLIMLYFFFMIVEFYVKLAA